MIILHAGRILITPSLILWPKVLIAGIPKGAFRGCPSWHPLLTLKYMASRVLREVNKRYKVVAIVCQLHIVESLWYHTLRRLFSLGKFAIKKPKRILYGLSGGAKRTGQTKKLSDEKVSLGNIQMVFNQRRAKVINGEDTVTPKLPIVFIHSSNSDYLKYSLAQAKASNPGSTIYLLGDFSNDCYDFVEHHLVSEYSEEANALAKVYRHYSTTGIDFELFRFQRWIILRDFAVVHNINRCLYLDSDVMLYADVGVEQKKFEQFDFTLSHRICGSTFFLNRIEALNDFCKFLFDVYSKKKGYYFDKMVSHWVVRNKNGLRGGVCDMTAFELFSGQHIGEIGETAHIIDGSVYDPSINAPHPGFEMSEGIKSLIWKNGVPYGKHIITGKEIRFNSLHCQGRAKKLMSRFMSDNTVN
jgi:hypothetical protein